MKRYFACILALILLIPCLAVPASATTQGVIDAIEDQTDNLGSQFVSWFYELGQQIEVASQDIVTAIHDKVDYLAAVLDGLFSGVKADIHNILEGVKNIYSRMQYYFDPWSNYFQQIAYNIQQLVKGDITNSNEFNDDLIPVETEVDEILDSIETAPTIDQEGIDGVFDTVGDPSELDPNYVAMLSIIMNLDAFFFVMLYCFVFAILGFILYGKR